MSYCHLLDGYSATILFFSFLGLDLLSSFISSKLGLFLNLSI
nr:MAG TPA: hypothetical protein [Caudoviricetes sp.]